MVASDENSTLRRSYVEVLGIAAAAAGVQNACVALTPLTSFVLWETTTSKRMACEAMCRGMMSMHVQ